jgi:hypothetical protein
MCGKLTLKVEKGEIIDQICMNCAMRAHNTSSSKATKKTHKEENAKETSE